MTKASIVQRLLDEGKITAEEAVVLLQPAIQYVPYQSPSLPYQQQLYWQWPSYQRVYLNNASAPAVSPIPFGSTANGQQAITY